MENIITHPGIIVLVETDKIHVRISSVSACSTCHAKRSCVAAEMEDKIIEAANDHKMNYYSGQEVIIGMEKSLGSHAILMGYFYPFLVVLGTLIVFINLTRNEAVSAIVSLGMLIPYYTILYRMRNKLSKKFEFRIKH